MREGGPLDLTDALCGDAPDSADVAQLGLTAVQQTVAAAHDVLRTLIKTLEHLLETLTILMIEHDFVGPGGRLAGDQITQ